MRPTDEEELDKPVEYKSNQATESYEMQSDNSEEEMDLGFDSQVESGIEVDDDLDVEGLAEVIRMYGEKENLLKKFRQLAARENGPELEGQANQERQSEPWQQEHVQEGVELNQPERQLDNLENEKEAVPPPGIQYRVIDRQAYN
ncbi:hypothetical protein HK100_010269 [Physocladia obscura]|uniref:Uncharacterized protein n=1 Tax=Physocladia obscura TaxID=109957 RepID=A0AAD5SM01_9FUNG|nr:hypothetical protein HK100_010269 [Physocladia obscura]